MMDHHIPRPAVERLSILYSLLEELEQRGRTVISSAELGAIAGVPAHTVRKDISYLEGARSGGAGYPIGQLRESIGDSLGINVRRRVCIVGLGNIGTALLNYRGFMPRGYDIVAGFDTNVNRLEILETAVPLHPAHEIETVVARENIELAVIAVPAEAAQETADRLMRAGIGGIVNFAPVIIHHPHEHVFVRNVFVVGEFRILTALMTLDKTDEEE
jgi:redox-sensing transcriptional repressor